MQKQPFPVGGGGSKKFEDWGGRLKKFWTGERIADLGGGYFCWGGVSTHYMPWKCQFLPSFFQRLTSKVLMSNFDCIYIISAGMHFIF